MTEYKKGFVVPKWLFAVVALGIIAFLVGSFVSNMATTTSSSTTSSVGDQPQVPVPVVPVTTVTPVGTATPTPTATKVQLPQPQLPVTVIKGNPEAFEISFAEDKDLKGKVEYSGDFKASSYIMICLLKGDNVIAAYKGAEGMNTFNFDFKRPRPTDEEGYRVTVGVY